MPGGLVTRGSRKGGEGRLSCGAASCVRTHNRMVVTSGPARQDGDRDLMQSSGVRSTYGVLAVRARTSRAFGLPSPGRPRAVRGTAVTVNPDAVRSPRTADSGQVREYMTNAGRPSALRTR